MSIPVSTIHQGGFYVNDAKGVVRQVWLFADMGNVHWRKFYLETGDPANDSCACSPETLARWANRLATAEEVARMKIEYAEITELAALEDLVREVFGADANSILR